MAFTIINIIINIIIMLHNKINAVIAYRYIYIYIINNNKILNKIK